MLSEQHVALAELNRDRLTPRLPGADWGSELAHEHQHRRAEIALLEEERASLRDRVDVPTDPDAFVSWFETLKETGPGQGDPLFPWLAQHATAEQMKWFLYQEVAGEAGFEDLVALAQLKLAPRAKLEMARNYWDEMGRGNEGGMHGPMLDRLSDSLSLSAMSSTTPLVWESLALGNIMLGLAANRRYAFHAIGALGAIELTAPTRAVHVNEGLKRLGIAPHARHYFALHATLDIKHSAAWNAEVLRPLVEARPDVASAIAEGALLRLEAGRRCFERYRSELGVGHPQEVITAVIQRGVFHRDPSQTVAR